MNPMDTQYKRRIKCQGCDRCTYGVISAGVIIIDSTRGFDELILACDDNGRFNDFGGHVDHESPSMCASRELFEESRGTVCISPSEIKECLSVRMHAGRHYHKIYFVQTYGVRCTLFFDVNTYDLPSVMLETSQMRRFNLEQLYMKYDIEHNVGDTIIDCYGNSQPLHSRARDGINLALHYWKKLT